MQIGAVAYVEVSLTEESKTKAIDKIIINGTSGGADANDTISPVALFSNEVPFNPAKVTGYEQIAFPRARSGTAAVTLDKLPQNTLSFRIYTNVCLNGNGGSDNTYAIVAANGEEEFSNDQTTRLAYVGVMKERLINEAATNADPETDEPPAPTPPDNNDDNDNDATAAEAAPALPLKIFPNPTNGELIIESGELKEGENIEVYDMAGVLCRRFKPTATNATLNLSHLPAGVYIVKAGGRTGKIVKQ
jgi:hypothetical protein